MLEEGVIVRVKDNRSATVELERKRACGSCSACSGGETGRMTIEAFGPAEVKTGDKVKLNIEARGVVLGIVLLYLLPAVGLIFGILLNPGKWGVVLGLIFMPLFFVIARYYGKRKVSYSARIIEMIE